MYVYSTGTENNRRQLLKAHMLVAGLAGMGQALQQRAFLVRNTRKANAQQQGDADLS